jgi:hypothetical protein
LDYQLSLATYWSSQVVTVFAERYSSITIQIKSEKAIPNQLYAL